MRNTAVDGNKEIERGFLPCAGGEQVVHNRAPRQFQGHFLQSWVELQPVQVAQPMLI